MTFKHMLAAATILAVPTAALAQPVTGLYVGAGAGANFLQNETIKRFSVPGGELPARGTNPTFDTGYVALGSIGYGLGNGVRVELEGNYRDNQLNKADGVERYKATGSEDKYGAMVNAFYDFSFGDFGLDVFDSVSPYVGVGAGYAQVRYHGVNVPTGGGDSISVNNGYDTFAYQAIAGVAYPLYSVVPGLSLTAEYRFYATPQDRKYKSQIIDGGASASGFKISDDMNHSVMVGLRYAFDVPAPPAPAPTPVAAPIAAPTRTYLVFFDWDKSDLTARARSIISDAAQNSTRVTYTRIEVNGYTDLSGTPKYNQGLSVRRAQSVATELERDGVPQNAIDIQGFGQTHPLVPTAAGVREPQNRRVEIIIK